MKRIILLFIFVILICYPVFGASLKAGYPICVTKELYQQFERAVIQDDKRELQYLKKSGCFMPAQELKVTILDQSLWAAIIRIRVFAGDQAFEMWTASKNVKRK
jgi:hypothetical protein